MALLLLLVACASGGNPAREAIDASAAAPAPTAAPAATFWCPMHPEVSRDGPGKCPKCGMDLVKKEG